MNTDTPESLTACYDDEQGEPCVPLTIAIKLERERNELKRWTSVNGVIDLQRERDEAREERDRLAEVINAATILIAAKGRHNTMLAYEGLRATLQSLTPNAEP
jgi:hypothetical protein